jgi:membrane fusion protein, macrolide-specific efflux system
MPSRFLSRLVALAAVLALAGCYLFPKEEKVLAPPLLVNPEVSYSTTEVKKGTITVESSLNGTFASMTETPLYFRVSGSRLKSVAVKLGDEVKAGMVVAELDTGSLETRIAEQKILLRKAQVVSERAVVMGRDRFEKELASLDVDLAALQLQDLQDTLGAARLVTPVAGRVVYVGIARPGDLVDAFRTLVQVDDPRALQLVCRGTITSDFTVGAAVSVSLPDGRRLGGTVVQSPSSLPPDVPDSLRNAVVVKMASLPAGVSLGDPATITRLIARHENVLVVPRDLVHTYLGRDFVRVLKDGAVEERTVVMGIQTATEVEVTSGLSVGEQVLSP